MNFAVFAILLIVSCLPLFFVLTQINFFKFLSNKQEFSTGFRKVVGVMYGFSGGYLWMLWGAYCAGLARFFVTPFSNSWIYYIAAYFYGSFIFRISRRLTHIHTLESSDEELYDVDQKEERVIDDYWKKDKSIVQMSNTEEEEEEESEEEKSYRKRLEGIVEYLPFSLIYLVSFLLAMLYYERLPFSMNWLNYFLFE